MPITLPQVESRCPRQTSTDKMTEEPVQFFKNWKGETAVLLSKRDSHPDFKDELAAYPDVDLLAMRTGGMFVYVIQDKSGRFHNHSLLAQHFFEDYPIELTREFLHLTDFDS